MSHVYTLLTDGEKGVIYTANKAGTPSFPKLKNCQEFNTTRMTYTERYEQLSLLQFQGNSSLTPSFQQSHRKSTVSHAPSKDVVTRPGRIVIQGIDWSSNEENHQLPVNHYNTPLFLTQDTWELLRLTCSQNKKSLLQHKRFQPWIHTLRLKVPPHPGLTLCMSNS